MIWPLDYWFRGIGVTRCWMCEQDRNRNPFPAKAVAVVLPPDPPILFIYVCERCLIHQEWLPQPAGFA
jgi:hypothetical protein